MTPLTPFDKATQALLEYGDARSSRGREVAKGHIAELERTIKHHEQTETKLRETIGKQNRELADLKVLTDSLVKRNQELDDLRAERSGTPYKDGYKHGHAVGQRDRAYTRMRVGKSISPRCTKYAEGLAEGRKQARAELKEAIETIQCGLDL